MTEIKPCPFCGGEAKLQRFGRFYYISCENENCECLVESGYMNTEESAVESWNRRANDDSCKDTDRS